MKLIDAPVGLFLHDGTLCLKTEYNSGKLTENGYITTPDCYICSSGEYFWGGMYDYEDRNELEVIHLEGLEDIARTKTADVLRKEMMWSIEKEGEQC